VINSRQFRKIDAYQNTDTQYGIRIAYRILCNVGAVIVGLLFLAISASACAKQPTPFRPHSSTTRIFPTAQARAAPTSTELPIKTPLPTATQSCTNNLTFLETVSIPDGTLVHPGDQVDKRWLVQNSGSCNWDEHYLLKSITGTGLDAPIELALYPARSGAKVTIRIQLIAPSEPGSYQGTWQAYDPQGQPFGDLLVLLIVVDSDM
jgi:hypothetical protein